MTAWSQGKQLSLFPENLNKSQTLRLEGNKTNGFPACSAGVFLGRASVFARKSAMLKPKRKQGESKGEGRGRGERRENARLKTL